MGGASIDGDYPVGGGLTGGWFLGGWNWVGVGGCYGIGVYLTAGGGGVGLVTGGGAYLVG